MAKTKATGTSGQGIGDVAAFGTLLNQIRSGYYQPGMMLDRAVFQAFPQTAAGAAGINVNTLTGSRARVPIGPTLSKGVGGVVRMGGRRIPLIAGGIQTLSGDPIGGIGTAGGGLAGAALGAKIGSVVPIVGTAGGAIIGGLIGSNVGQGVTRGLAGIDVNNPLTGPDINLAGIPLSQFAKTKKSIERATELEKKRYEELAPLYEKARNQQMARDMIAGQMGLAQTMLGSVYGR